MDFGCDIYDFKELARDTAMLLAIIHIIKNKLTDIELIIEVYGPGVDAHDDYNTVMENIDKMQPAKQEIDKDKIKQLYDILNDNRSDENPLEILERGRATGNYLEAFRLCYESTAAGGRRKNKKNCKGGAPNEAFVNNWLAERIDLSKKNPKKK